MANTDKLAGWSLADIPPGAYFIDISKREGHTYVKAELGSVVRAQLVEVNPLGADAQVHRRAMATGVSPVERFASTLPVAFPDDAFFKRISTQIAAMQNVNPTIKRQDLPALGDHDPIGALDVARERAQRGLASGEENNIEAKEHRFTYQVWAQAQTEKSEAALALQIQFGIAAAAELARRNERLAMDNAIAAQNAIVERLIQARERIEKTQEDMAVYREEHPWRAAIQDRFGFGAPKLVQMQETVASVNRAIDKDIKPAFEASVSTVRSLEHSRILNAAQARISLPAPSIETSLKTGPVRESALPSLQQSFAGPRLGM